MTNHSLPLQYSLTGSLSSSLSLSLLYGYLSYFHRILHRVLIIFIVNRNSRLDSLDMIISFSHQYKANALYPCTLNCHIFNSLKWRIYLNKIGLIFLPILNVYYV